MLNTVSTLVAGRWWTNAGIIIHLFIVKTLDYFLYSASIFSPHYDQTDCLVFSANEAVELTTDERSFEKVRMKLTRCRDFGNGLHRIDRRENNRTDVGSYATL